MVNTVCPNLNKFVNVPMTQHVLWNTQYSLINLIADYRMDATFMIEIICSFPGSAFFAIIV